VSDSLTPVSQV